MSSPGTPLQLTAADISKLVDYIDVELGEALDEHAEKEQRLDKWQDAYDGLPKQKRKDFPFPNACNIVIPLIGIAVDSIVARLVNTIFSVEPFWSIRPLRKEVEAAAKPIESFMEWSRQQEFNMYSEVRKVTPEVVKFGWGYMKARWSVTTNRTFKIDDNGVAVPQDEVIRRPVVEHIPLRDVITQPGIEDELHQAEWIAQRFRKTDDQLRWMQHDGIVTDVEDVIAKKDEDSPPGTERERQNNESRQRDRPKLNTLFEINADIRPQVNSSLSEKIILTYHRPTRKIIRAIHNPNITGKRELVKLKFLEREGRLEGQGIAARLNDMQEEISTLHCQQVDNATLANTRFFIGRRGAVRPSTKIWPGRFLTVPDPERDVKAMQMGDIYGSMFRLSTEILSFSERASGVSDPFLGRESSVAGSRATATGTLAILQEGNRRFDLNVRDIRESLSELGRRVLELNQQYRPKGIAFFVLGEEGQLVEQMLDLPKEFLGSRMAVELTASTATINREVEKQGLINLLGLLTQYYERLLQIGTLISTPGVPDPVKSLGVKMAEGAKFVMERLLQTFEMKNLDAVLPSLLAELQGANDQAGAAGQAVGIGSPTGLGGGASPLGISDGAGNGRTV